MADAGSEGGDLDLGGLRGLSDAEATRRLEAEGPNALPDRQDRGVVRIAVEVATEPMFLLLVGAGALYLVMGEPADAAVLLGFVGVVMGITIVQERRTERALDALRDLSSPRALVIRAGGERRIAGRDVVRGDLVVLAEGDRVPADGVVRRALHLAADESLLTGESVPVRKVPSADADALDAPGGDDHPSVFAGTLVTSGQAVIEVLATGPRSQLGRIGDALREIAPEETPLQAETGRLVRRFAVAGLAACAVVVVAYAVGRGGSAEVWREGLLAGIAMAMATLPEEFPVVLTVFLAVGAWRLSRSHALARRMPAIEALGAATVLCTDKTGTLTHNRMTVRVLRAGPEARSLGPGAGEVRLPDALRRVLAGAALASARDAFDPMERAVHAAAAAHLGASPAEGLRLARAWPLTPARLAVTRAWEEPGGAVRAACKGAPEAVAALCGLDAPARAALQAEVDALAAEGARVLAVAEAEVAGPVPDDPDALGLRLLGLIGFEDPLRDDVPGAVAECRAAGVRVVMVTGDAPATARAIARQAGLANPDRVVTGQELDAADDDALRRLVGEVQVFARTVPAQKLRLVRALRDAGEVVAMTGDGVNDAPALKAAHIGVAMGERGTDVAREAAAIVLLDDAFASIVGAVRLGRRIDDNLRKAIAYVVAVHVPIAGLSMLPILSPDWPLLLLPVHVVFLELVIDPSCTLVYEAEDAEPGAMARPPRPPGEPLFSARLVGAALAQGLLAFVACVAVFLRARADHPPDAVRALVFVTLVVASLAILVANRSRTALTPRLLATPNAAFRWVAGGAALTLGAALTVPFVRGLFHFAPVPLADVAVSGVAGLACAIAFDLAKLAGRRD